MGRYIAFIVVVVLLLLFLGMNWSNGSGINFWFGKAGRVENVPICLSFLFVFLLGALSSLPVMFRIVVYYRKREKERFLDQQLEQYRRRKEKDSNR